MKTEFKDEVECFQKRINKIERKINKKQLKPDNSDRFISKLRKLAKNILQSQPYNIAY